MAYLRNLKNSSNWIAQWTSKKTGKKITRSTGIPIKLGVNSDGEKITSAQAKLEAQRIANLMESTESGNKTAAKAREAVENIIKESFGEDHTSPIVADWLAKIYESKSKTSSAGTMKCYNTAFREFREFIGEKRIRDVTRGDINDFISHMLTYVRAGTVKRHMECVSAAFSAAYDAELIDRSPTRKYEIPKRAIVKDSQKRDAFTREQIKTLLSKLSGEWYSMVLFSLHTGGQRLGDIMSLKWNAINLASNSINFYTAKTNHKVSLPISPILKIHINKLERINDYIHPTLSKRTQSSLSTEFISLLIGLGISTPIAKNTEGRKRNMSALSFHSLRSTATTFMHEAGVPESIVREIVGHDSEAVHRIYKKFGTSTLENALSKI